MEIIFETTRKARKEYDCNASLILSLFIQEQRTDLGFSFGDLRQIINAKNEGCKILKGQLYRYYVIKEDGELSVCRERHEIAEICTKYDLWPAN